MIAAFGIGNTVQSNAIADVLATNTAVPTWLTGLVLAVLAFLVIIGGVRRIARLAERLVPLMALVYVAGALLVIGANIAAVPGRSVPSSATPSPARRPPAASPAPLSGARSASAPIAHAAARTSDPVRQGTVAMLGTYTIVVCTMTALVIIVSGIWPTGESGAGLTSLAFGDSIAGGNWIVTFGLVVFAFTTIVAWSYDGERCAEYLFGVNAIMPYRCLWVILLFIGAAANLSVL